MINKYVTFCRTYNVDHIDPSPQTLCAYMEYLVDHFTSPNSVLNYISAIKLLHNYRGKEATAFKCFDVILMIRAIKITMRTIPHRAPPLSVDILKQLCHKCQKYGTVGLTVRLAMQLAFYAFLRGSNLCPHTSSKFDSTRHLTRGDIEITPQGLLISLKWSKTLQKAGNTKYIPVPKVDNELLDATTTFKRLKSRVQVSHKAPLFSLNRNRCLTLFELRRIFALLLRKIGCDTHFTLHSLRRAGASTCFSLGAKDLDIQKQGTWVSSSYKQYIVLDNKFNNSVCQALVAASK